MNDILAVLRFLGDGITDEQIDQLMDMVKNLSIADREALLCHPDAVLLQTELSMHNAEMGGLHRY